MADNTITIVGQPHPGPGDALHARAGRPNATLRRRGEPAVAEPPDAASGRSATSFFNVVCWGDMAENVSDSIAQGHARRRDRPARAAQLGDRAGREALGRRDRRRRGRPEPAVGDRRGEAHRASRRRRPAAAAAAAAAGGGGGGGGAGPAGPGGRRRAGYDDVRRRRALLARRPERSDDEPWHETGNGSGKDAQGRRPTAHAQEEDVDPQPGAASTGSTTRTSTCCGGSCRSGPRSGPAGSPATTSSSRREVAKAIRVAREMALLPYSVRQVTQRSRSGRRDRGDRGDRGARRCRRRTRRRPWSAERRRAARGRDGRRRSSELERADGRRSTRPTATGRRRAASRRTGGDGVKVVLRDDVEKLGQKGDLSTSPTATPATTSCRAGSRSSRRKGVVQQADGDAAQPRRSATTATGKPRRTLADRLAGTPVEVTARAGEGGRLFGSVTAADIVAAVAGADRRRARPAQDRRSTSR